MPDTVADRVHRWASEEIEDSDFLVRLEQIDFLAERLFANYHPALSFQPDFMVRLRDWLNQVAEMDQKTLFELVPQLFFIGPDEFQGLYRSSFLGAILTWLIEQEGISLDDAIQGKALTTAVNETWFCPITDSMPISQFYHVNNLTGPNLRPDWWSLAEFAADDERIIAYMGEHNLKRIVLVEDFVGSGRQISRGVLKAANLRTIPPVLIVPLVICPRGVERGADLMHEYPHVKIVPALELGAAAFLKEDGVMGNNRLSMRLWELVHRIHLHII